DPNNLAAVRDQIKLLYCPAARSPRTDTNFPKIAGACGDYTATHGVNPGFYKANGLAEGPVPGPLYDGAMYMDRRTPLETIADGTDNTILLVEDSGRPELFQRGRRISGSTTTGAAWADPEYEIGLDGSDYTGVAANGPCVINCNNDNEVY